MPSNDVLADIEKGRQAYDAMPGLDQDGVAEHKVQRRIAAALERIAVVLEQIAGEK